MKTKKYFLTGLLAIVFLSSVFYLIWERSNFSLGPPVWPQSLPKVDSAESFTFIVLPDTQFYSANYPGIFCGQTDWIAANQKRLNIAFVSQLGDIVNEVKASEQWQVASTCLGRLNGKVPYGLVPGNHDAEVFDQSAAGLNTYNAYNRVFPPENFLKYSWYKGNYQGNRNNYEIIEINNKTFLFLNLEYDPAADVIAWAQDSLSQYPGAYIILTTHRYLPDKAAERDETGERLWRELVYKNCSVKMVWSAHYHKTDGENRLTSLNSCGHKVEQITQDYQARENGGNGLLRIYKFTPRARRIDVYTYSTETGALETDDDSRFTIFDSEL